MKPYSSMLTASILLLAGAAANADGGEKALKQMSRNADVTVMPEEVGQLTSEAEHALHDLM